MDVNPTINFREASPQEDSIVARHFYQLWRDNDVPPELIRSDWLEVTIDYIIGARQTLFYKAFLAEADGEIIGSASSQLFAGLYPLVLSDNYRKYGYVWGVYVEPDYRNRGIGKKLTSLVISHLEALNCTKVILNASPSGKPLYQSLGFVETNGMELDLRSPCR